MTPLLALAEVQAHIGCLENVSTETLEMVARGFHEPVRLLYMGWVNVFFSPSFQEAASIGHELEIRKMKKMARIRESLKPKPYRKDFFK